MPLHTALDSQGCILHKDYFSSYPYVFPFNTGHVRFGCWHHWKSKVQLHQNLVLGVWSSVAGYLNQPIKFHCERDCKKLYLDQSLKLHNPTIVFLHTHTQRNTPTTVVRTHKKGHATTKLDMQSGKHFFSMTCRRNGMQRQLLHTAINTLQLFNCAQWNQLVPRFLIFTILSSNF